MLCFVCLVENRGSPAKGVTFVQGTTVCREHLTAVGTADALSLSYKLRQRMSAVPNNHQE